MSNSKRGLVVRIAFSAATTLLLIPGLALAQTPPAKTSSSPSTTSAKQDRWLHVRVISSDAKGETVRVNGPLDLAEKVLPAINHDRLHGGKVKIDCAHMNDVDLRAMVEAKNVTWDVCDSGSGTCLELGKQGHLRHGLVRS